MYQKEYKRMNERIGPSDDLNRRVLETALPRRRRVLRPVLVTAAVCLTLVMAVPVMAAYVPEISDLMYQVSPEVASRFTPVQESDTNNGIRMEVVATSIHGSTAEVCLSFEDLEGERLGEQIRIGAFRFLGYGRSVNSSGGGGSGVADYNTETGKLMNILEWTFNYKTEKAEGLFGNTTSWSASSEGAEDGQYLSVKELYGDKMTIRVDELYWYNDLLETQIPIVLSEADIMTVRICQEGSASQRIEAPIDLNHFGRGASLSDELWLHQEEYKLLTPGASVHTVMEGLDVMGMAYIDGQLHIQIRNRSGAESVHEGFRYEIWFTDGQGGELTGIRSNSFVIEEGESWGRYKEHIFDIPEEELSNLQLMCHVKETESIQGPWRVTFPVTESDYVGEWDDGVPATEKIF